MMNQLQQQSAPMGEGVYQGHSTIEWSLAVQDPGAGWLMPMFHARFREVLAHTAFRFKLVCPIYCLLPNRLQMLWMGMDIRADQEKAASYLQRHFGRLLYEVGFELCPELGSVVLSNGHLTGTALQQHVETIARYPESEGLVPEGRFREYVFTECLVPGHPELSLWDPAFWCTFNQIYQGVGGSRPSNG